MARIAFVSDTIHSYFGSEIPEGTGGAERQQNLIARALRDRGHDVIIVTLNHPNVRTGFHDGLQVHPIIPDVRGRLNAPYKFLQTIRGLRRVDADVYYVRGNDFLCVTTSLFCRLSNVCFVYAVANDSNVEPSHLQSKNRLFARQYLSAIDNADAVTVLTPYQKQVLVDEHGIQSTVIPCGYDIPPSEEVLDQDDREFVLWVGRLHEDQKRPELFLDAAERCSEIPFVMIGPPDNDDQGREYFDKITQRASEIENLNFIEYVSPYEIHEYFRRASLLANTSAYEGFGNVFLEAWRYETPVVTLDYTLHGIISEESAGLQANSVDNMSTIISELHRDEKRRLELGTEGRALVKNRFSIEAVTDQYESIFDDVISNDKKPN